MDDGCNCVFRSAMTTTKSNNTSVILFCLITAENGSLTLRIVYNGGRQRHAIKTKNNNINTRDGRAMENRRAENRTLSHPR